MAKHTYECELNWEMGDNATCTCGADAQQEALDVRKQLAALQAENAKLREAGRKLLMVTLPPHDVSGRAMYDEAKQVIHGN